MSHPVSSCLFYLSLIIASSTAAITSSSGQTLVDPARAADALSRQPAGDHLSTFAEEAISASLEDENFFAPTTPGDSDIGHQLILKRHEKVQPFSLWLNTNAYWTDNAANTTTRELEDWFFTASITAAWQQRLGSSRFYGDIYASQQWYLYDELSELDYEFGEAGIGTLVLLPELFNSVFHVHYVYQRITQGLDDSALYQSHNVRLGLQKTFLINHLNSAHLALSSVLALDTEPDILQRHEYAAHAGYSFKVTRSFILSLNYRVTYFDYFNLQNRQDWYQNAGASLTWTPVKNLDVILSYNFALNDSNYDVFDYETNLAGPGLSVKFKF